MFIGRAVAQVAGKNIIQLQSKTLKATFFAILYLRIAQLAGFNNYDYNNAEKKNKMEIWTIAEHPKVS